MQSLSWQGMMLLTQLYYTAGRGRKIPCAGRVCEPENEAYGAGDSGWKHCGVAVQKRPENGVRLLPVPQCVRI